MTKILGAVISSASEKDGDISIEKYQFCFLLGGSYVGYVHGKSNVEEPRSFLAARWGFTGGHPI